MSDPLHLNDVFWTFQGEGANAGRRALFVRMPYCNLACSWCDTKFDTFTKWSEEDFVKFASQETGRFAVLTGGEPTMNKHSPRVLRILKDLGFMVACESNGTFAPPDGIDWLTISPKRDAEFKVHPDAFAAASEFKYVVDREFDFALLERHQHQLGAFPQLFLSPEFTEMPANLQRIFAYVKEHPKWRISLQTHKWLNIP